VRSRLWRRQVSWLTLSRLAGALQGLQNRAPADTAIWVWPIRRGDRVPRSHRLISESRLKVHRPSPFGGHNPVDLSDIDTIDKLIFIGIQQGKFRSAIGIHILVIQLIRGFRDILPGDVELWQYVEQTAVERFSRFGFREIR